MHIIYRNWRQKDFAGNGPTSDLSYYSLKKRIEDLNPQRKKCDVIPSQKDHVPRINLEKFDADHLTVKAMDGDRLIEPSRAWQRVSFTLLLVDVAGPPVCICSKSGTSSSRIATQCVCAGAPGWELRLLAMKSA